MVKATGVAGPSVARARLPRSAVVLPAAAELIRGSLLKCKGPLVFAYERARRSPHSFVEARY